MIEIPIALSIAGLIVLPHLLPLELVSPARASAIWFLALTLRALVAIGVAVFVFVYLSQTALFEALLRSCWHAVLPLVSTHLGLSGHPFANAALLLPGLAVSASVIWVLFGLVRGWHALRAQLLRRPLGEGPFGSTVVQDDGVLIAVPRIGRARVMVSKTALDVMDADELAAGLAHELGHIRRRHRPLLLAAAVLAALGRLLPGTGAAERAFTFNLERDADEYAIRKTRDPLALASAICKTAGSHPSASVAALGGGGGITIRLDYLLDGSARRGGPILERMTGVLVVLMTAAVLAISLTLPAWALAAPGAEQTLAHSETVCAQ